LKKQDRITAFASLGNYLRSNDTTLEAQLQQASWQHAWFTVDNLHHALNSIATMLEYEALTNWLTDEDFEKETNQWVGLILAGNIPLVGFHDILSCLAAGFGVKIKLSSNDAILTKHVVEKLIEIEPRFKSKIEWVDRLTDFDLVIATGSNNSARYFEYYFGKKPHIIRKNRNSVGVLWGDETPAQLNALGLDIFLYFGLGCRNVSKIYLPENYNIATFYENIETFQHVFDHHKYANNYDYNKSIYLINGNKHYDNGFLLLKEDVSLTSPLAVVHYETYSSETALISHLIPLEEQLQCVVTTRPLPIPTACVSPGQSQHPGLTDYADGVDILAFLKVHVPRGV
jgi:hypothetical protein